MKNFTNDMFSRCVPDWTKWLAGKRFHRGLEIGSFEGQSACWMLDNNAVRTLDCVDAWSGDWGYVYAESTFDANTSEYGSRLGKHKGDAALVLPRLLAAGNRFQFIYIDGDHQGRAALRDMVLAWEMLDMGGIMVVDDVHTGDPVDKSFVLHAVQGFLNVWGPFVDVEHGTGRVLQVKITRRDA